ncbi:MMPL family transporter [Aeromicrobium sp. NPDC092404]|uniref:MMPL family transporter n=1 Tax=Aeromicrobium sp. NPDC092404 TaxID=3154976 RepID=UPI00343BECF1
MSRILYRLGHFSGRHPWRILAAWIVVGVSVFMLNSTAGGSPDESFTIPGAESQRAADAVADRFPQETVYTSNVIFHSDKGLEDPATKAAIEQTVQELADGEKVVSVSSPYDPRGPTLSEDGKTAFATVAFDENEIGKKEYTAAAKAAEHAVDAGVQVEYDNGLGYAKGEAAGPSSEKVGILVAIVVLAVAFGSLVALSIPLITALFGLLIGTSSLGYLSGLIAVPEIANIVGMMLGLGVGIDYALFILSRHRQNLDDGMTVPEAIGQANSSAGLSVVFAGLTVIVAIAGLQVSGVPMMSVMGWASALMVLITMLAAITLLPAILGIVKTKVNAAKIPFIKQRPANDPSSGSARWAAKVVEHPVRYGVVATVILAVLAAPVFSMRLGFTDASNDGSGTTTRKAYDIVADAYGPGTNGPFQVVLETHDAPDADAAVDRVADALAADKGVASVEQPSFNEGKDIAIIGVTPTSAPQDAETSDTLHRLRDSVLPDALGDSKVESMVTGGTAMSEDVSNRLQDRMPLFLGAVIGLSFLVLMLVFRSVLVPLKAAALNLLSVGASYGVIVAVFQWGWAANLIGVEGSVPIMPLAPMLMFAILFGLSMDYEVFLLSRVREQFMRHGNAKKALVEGVASTGRVITSAALIMISVFASFILMPDVTAKMFGVGLAVAVLLDVTLVRMVLVPAAMSLLGDRAWWLPTWLDRLLPSIDLEGGYSESTLTQQDQELLEEGEKVLV